MKQEPRWKHRFDNYQSALRLLQRVIPEGEVSETEGLAIVQAFEIVAELSWKVLADYMREQGIEHERSPKATIREAFNIGVVSDGQLWMDLIQARNQTSHVYRSDVAEVIVRDIMKKYLPAFDGLAATFTQLDDE